MKKSYTLRLNPELIKKADEIAKAEKMNRSELIRMAITLYLQSAGRDASGRSLS